MSENIINATDDNFEIEVLMSPIPVLVDFWAEWCGPCRTLTPILEDVAKEYKDKVKVVKVNVDNSNDTAVNYDVRGIPTLIIFKDGKVMATKVGALAKTQLTSFIDTHLK